MIIPKTLQKRAVAWYHHYLQHSGHSHLEETLKAAMYWKIFEKMSNIMSKPVNPVNLINEKS